MKDEIIKFLEKEEKAYTLEELINGLDISKKDITRLEDELNSLILSGDIYLTKREKYMLFKYCHLKKGVINVNKSGDAYILLDNEKIIIPNNYLNGAINKDYVNFEIDDSKNPIEGKVINIIKREYEEIPGEVISDNNKFYVIPSNPKLKIKIEIPTKDLNGAVVGTKVCAKINYGSTKNKCTGKITKIVGHKDDPGIDIKLIALEHNIPIDFNEKTIAELDNIPNEVLKEEYNNKKDLTNELIFTIDGDDTKDIDDAISLKKNDDGTYNLKVCIANVSYYVEKNSCLDKEALERGNSVYLANTVIPMLPHYLSNGICSLNPNVDRLALCCDMQIDKNGNIFEEDIYECIIRSKKQMTYKCVNKILEENIIPEGYEEFADNLHLMKELSDILRENKYRRGSIDFDQNEAKVIIDDTGKCIDVVLRDRGAGEKLIEDFMIAANESVATHLYNMDLPCVYRVHEYPEKEKIDDFLRYISLIGYQVHGKKGDISPKAMQKILEELNTTPVYQILSSKLLRCMTKAYYSSTNLGHYGIASKRYCHFTSPIRRYADLCVHRIIRRFIINHDYNNKTISEINSDLDYICNHISETERISIEAEREVDKMEMASYMEDHIGDIYTGTIVSMASYGLYVSLPNKIEGLVHISEIGDSYYEYNEINEVMCDRNGKIVYRLGDEVEVEVISASKEERTIDFKIYNNGDNDR